MITIPEGMGLEDFAQGEPVANVVGVRQKGSRRFSVPRGSIRSRYRADRDWDYTTAREGEAPQKFRVAEVDMKEKRVRGKYLKIAPGSSVSVPERMVRVISPDAIAPVSMDPNFEPVEDRLLEPEPEEIMARENVEIFDPEAPYQAVTKKARLPGYRGWQQFPAESEMQAPDKLTYRNPVSERPSWNEREEVHEEYDKEGEEEASASGIQKMPDDTPLSQFDVILSVAAAAITAGATGFKAYSDIKQAKEARKAVASQAEADAARSAALFSQQFNPLGPKASSGSSPRPSYAPTSMGPDWTTIAIYAGGGLAVLALAYMFLRR